MLSNCAGLLNAVVCCGTNMARPLLLLELKQKYDPTELHVIEAVEKGGTYAS